MKVNSVKELCGLPRREAPNRINSNSRVKPCPDYALDCIKDAFKYFGMIK
ncbi:MAG: hypothetical protein HUJ68_08080 [Clostridia bacterium]|nr:hypothetical protein [Clostridia bacterium]